MNVQDDCGVQNLYGRQCLFVGWNVRKDFPVAVVCMLGPESAVPAYTKVDMDHDGP